MKFGINMAALVLSGLVLVGCNKDADKQAADAAKPANMNDAKPLEGGPNMATTKASDMTSKAADMGKGMMGKAGDEMKTMGDKMKATTQP